MAFSARTTSLCSLSLVSKNFFFSLRSGNWDAEVIDKVPSDMEREVLPDEVLLQALRKGLL